MIKIRAAMEADLPPILEIYNEIILNTTAVYDYRPHTLEMRKAWYDAKRRDGYPVLLAEEEGRILGFGSLGPFRAWAAYQYTVENSIYVDAALRGRGIGRILLAPLIRAAEQMDMHAVLAGIDSTNDASLALHRSFGFEEVARFKQVGYKFGRWLDLVFLEKLLEGPAKPEEPESINLLQ